MDISSLFSWMFDPNAWVALGTLTLLEIVLGIDNIIFIGVLINRLPAHQKDKARILGLFFAMLTRIALLVLLFWLTKLTAPLFSAFGLDISGRDLVLLIGGMFLLYKSTSEIHAQVFGADEGVRQVKFSSFWVVIVEIAFLDIIFSLDSVITAVGMANHLEIMIIAIVLAVIVMAFASGWISRFIDTYPTIKLLALAFLLVVGVVLIADGLHFHIPKGYVYFAMIFSLIVETLNILMRKKGADKGGVDKS